MKWIVILINLAAIFVFIGLRQYAHGYHKMDVEDAYQGLVSRGLVDDAKAAEYARTNNGWHPRVRIGSIGNPDGFLQFVFVIGVGVCIFNSAAIVFVAQKRAANAG